ncbi:fimbrial protein, partial [Escherichia coli]|nr:fimbrial protein [Escherichia coli]
QNQPRRDDFGLKIGKLSHRTSIKDGLGRHIGSCGPLNRNFLSFGGRVEVPQNCELNAGQIVEFDFGDIGASLFSAAGPGNRPAGVMPQTKSIAVKCTNVAAQAYLTMRLEASAVSGQAMVSDNQDLGFIVADQNDTPITPNDLNSVIPFRLDAAAAANVTLRAWPISITGQKPTEGPFSALGYLRVDYQ